jgi:hypothetical protein
MAAASDSEAQASRPRYGFGAGPAESEKILRLRLDTPTFGVVQIQLPQLAVVLPICDAPNAVVRTIK